MKSYLVYKQIWGNVDNLYVGIEESDALKVLESGSRTQDNHMEIWEDGKYLRTIHGIYEANKTS